MVKITHSRFATWLEWSVPLITAAILTACQRGPTSALPSKPLVVQEGSIAGTTSRDIVFDARAGQQFVARVEQFEFDARLELVDAAGRVLESVASPARGAGREYMYWKSVIDQRVKLRVVPVNAAPPSARFRTDVFMLENSTPRESITAFQAMTLGGKARRVGETTFENTASAYRIAEAIWTRQGETRLAADAALAAAMLANWDAEDWKASIAAANRAAAQYGALHDALGLAAALSVLGSSQLEVARAGSQQQQDKPAPDRFAAAADTLRRAINIYESKHAPIWAAQTQIVLAAIDYYHDDFDAAIAAYQQADQRLHLLGAMGERVAALNSLAAIKYDRGDYIGSASDYAQLIEATVLQPTHDRATALQNGAAANAIVGNAERALGWYLESLEIATKLNDQNLYSRALTGLGVVHAQLGQLELAVEYLKKAVEILRQSEDSNRLGLTLARLGDIYGQQSEFGRALVAHTEALRIAAPSIPAIYKARLIVALAGDESALGRNAVALQKYSRALDLPLPESNAVVATALIGRARVHQALGNTSSAQRDIERAVSLSQSNDDRENIIAALSEKARIARELGRSANALRASAAAIHEIERLQAEVGNPDNRVSILRRQRTSYELNIDLLATASRRQAQRGAMTSANITAFAALNVANRAVSRQIAPRGTTSSDSLTRNTEIENIYQLLVGKRYRLATLSERNHEPTPIMLTLQQDITLLRSKLAILGYADAASTAASPHSSPTKYSLQQLQLRIPENARLIAYWLGTDRSWCWVVWRNGFAMRPVSPRAEIDRRVADLMLHIKKLGTLPEISDALQALTKTIVPTDLIPAETQRLLIVPDGSIGAIPWALLAPSSTNSTIQLASITSLLDNSAISVWPDSTRPLRIALFGDPVFNRNDPRLPAQASGEPIATDQPFPRLAGTADEIAAIARVAGDLVQLRVTGVDATQSAVLALSPGSFDVLHLATHAVLDTQAPQFASLVLSRWDKAGRHITSDLRTYDILGLRARPNLVVLSACDTAAEPSSAAAGLLNLTRAFLLAHTHYVVASLWSVSDASAVALMSEFYRGLVVDRLPPDRALKNAQQAVATSKKWSAPFYWAGFVVASDVP